MIVSNIIIMKKMCNNCIENRNIFLFFIIMQYTKYFDICM